MTEERHPIIEALDARPPWTPARLTRVMQRVNPAVRTVSAKIDPIERDWHAITESALTAADGPGALPLWAALGDSTAQGIGASTIDHSWIARIDAALAADDRPHALVNLSRSGATSEHVIDEQLPLLDLLPAAPTIVTVCVGSNDLMRNPNPSALAERLNRLVAALPAGAIISALPAPSFSPTGRYVNRALRETAADHRVLVAELGPHMVAPHRGVSADLFHPNDRGYDAWMRAFAEQLGLDPDRVPAQGAVTSRLPGP
ncbi:MAG: SGNH/GDSL hydrolase family protein [Actinomycetota bacterium]